MSLTLINRSGRCLALNLPHAEVCTEARCFCVTLPGRPPRRVAGSITLPAGQALTDLSDALLGAAAVRALARSGELDVRHACHAPTNPSSNEPREPDAPPSKPARRKRGDSR